jgi:hypothetical protein
MTTTEVRLGVIAEHTGLNIQTVSYRLRALGITGRRITPRMNLYPYSAIKAVENFHDKEQSSVEEKGVSIPQKSDNNTEQEDCQG